MSTGGIFGGGGGMFGGPGGGMFGRLGPSGPYGAWPGCGCGTLFIIIGGLLLAFGGCLQLFRQ